MNRYIGGFLELELPTRPGPGYHTGALALSNARACISHIIARTQMRRVWLPYYTCDALLEPFEQAAVPYQFYALNASLEVADAPTRLATDEYFVCINYFGLQTKYVQSLADHYGDQLLIDNTQDFFARAPVQGWSFNSARKSFGVPDGGYLYGPAGQLDGSHYAENQGYQVQHLADRLRGAQQQAYEGFVAYERTLTSKPLQISAVSMALLAQVDYAEAARIRQINFARYHAALAHLNTLNLDLTAALADSATVPFCYPFLPAAAVDREPLFMQNIFVPWLWRDILSRIMPGYAWERDLTERLLPLPLDHRYGAAEIDFVLSCLRPLLVGLAD